MAMVCACKYLGAMLLGRLVFGASQLWSDERLYGLEYGHGFISRSEGGDQRLR